MWAGGCGARLWCEPSSRSPAVRSGCRNSPKHQAHHCHRRYPRGVLEKPRPGSQIPGLPVHLRRQATGRAPAHRGCVCGTGPGASICDSGGLGSGLPISAAPAHLPHRPREVAGRERRPRRGNHRPGTPALAHAASPRRSGTRQPATPETSMIDADQPCPGNPHPSESRSPTSTHCSGSACPQRVRWTSSRCSPPDANASTES